MYCVKCGVKLQEGLTACPLCNTPVWNPDGVIKDEKYSDKMPKKNVETKVPLAIFFTVLSLISIVVILSICLNLYKELSWGGYPIGAILLLYIMIILPMWFKERNPVIFSPINYLAIALFLLYINWKVDGNWFFTFALPILLIVAAASITVSTLARYVKKGGFYIAGGVMVFLGLATVLIEFFQTITFNTKMFTWSIYSLSVLFGFGMFFIIAGIYKPLKKYLMRHFFYVND